MRINALGNTATDFASDDYIALDGTTNGSRKMKNDSLLKVTAQNALAGKLAPAFDPTRTSSNPYKVGEVVIYEGKAYSFKVSHYGAWNASDVTTANLSPIQYISLSSSNIVNYNDCDNYPENSAVRCSNSSLASQVSNLPKTDQFAIFTYSAGGLLYQLLFMSTTNELYFRRKWANWASWSKLLYSASSINLVGSIDSTKAQSSPYNDLNTAPINEIIMYISSYSYVSNKPVNESFQAITIGASTGVKIQFVTTLTRKIYVRSYWGPNWSNWIYLGGIENLELSFAPDFSSLKNYAAGDIICHEGRLRKAFKPIAAGGSYSAAYWEEVNLENYKRTNIFSGNVAYYNDIDNFPPESVVSCLDSSLVSQISHLPENSQFTCFSFKGGSNDVSMQLFISGFTNELYFRRKWSTWTSWRKFAFVGETEPDTPNPLLAFDNIVAVGDSLTWCQVYTGVNISRQAKKLWCDMLAHSCGATAQTIAVAGDTAKTSWPRVDANLTAKDNAVIIVYLGTNGGLTDTLDVDAPVADPYTDWADTNTGCYAKIVAKAQSLGYKVLLIKPWAGGGGDLDTTNNVIDQIGTRFGCCVIGPFKTTETKYHYYPDLSGSNTLHYNDLGYAWFATALPYYVSRANNAQLKYIIPS